MCITYKIDAGADDNLMPFKIFKMFPETTIEALCATKNNWVMLKTHSQSNIEQLGVYSRSKT